MVFGIDDQGSGNKISCFCDFLQVDLLRLRCEGQSYMQELEHIVTQLKRADQLTQETLDDMLCRTPTGKRRPIMEERKTSRRTLRPLQSTLLSEWETLCARTKDSHTYLDRKPIKKHLFGYSCCIYLVRDTYAPIRRHFGLLSLLLSFTVWPKIQCENFTTFSAQVILQKAAGRMLQYCTALFGQEWVVYIKF